MGQAQGASVSGSCGPMARFGAEYAYDLLELSHSIEQVEAGGRWAVMIPYSGVPVFARFGAWEGQPRESTIGVWKGVNSSTWTSSMNNASYQRAVERT